MVWSPKEIIEGIRCETCYPRRFGEMVNDKSDNLYLYMDIGGNTRCFCKKHMTYGIKGSCAIMNFDNEWDYVSFGAELKSVILERLKE